MSNGARPADRRAALETGGAQGGVQSVDRAITALETIARLGEAGVGEVAGELGVHKSTASRLLGALESRALVEQVGERGRYRLGFGLLRLAGAIPSQLDLTGQGGSVCAELARTLGETVNLAVLQGRHVVNLHQVHGQSAITVNNWVGRPTPLHATSSGKVLLAPLGAATRADLLGVDLERFTPATITDLEELRRRLDQAVTDGYALTLEEYEVGLNAIASPVRGLGDAVVGAVSVSGPAYRLTADRLIGVRETVTVAAAEISRRMGSLDAARVPTAG